MSPWDDEERVTALRELWGQGLSASKIAYRLGEVSRNAVISKAHRLGLADRPSPIKRGGPKTPGSVRVARYRVQRRGKPRNPKARGCSPETIEAIRTMTEQGATIKAIALTLGIGTATVERYQRKFRQPGDWSKPGSLPVFPACQYPTGDKGDWHFCGAPSAEGRPYCNHHCAMAYRGAA